MARSGFSHMLCFLISLVVGHALMIVLAAHAQPVYRIMVALGEVTDDIFSITYTHREIGAFILATLCAFLIGSLFSVLFRMT
ncbi:MAG TPA: hypothetical protein PKJ77_09500 [Thermodesulfobacteriota bacterium]|nr:hypothetical protein [Thermodesulfobacteriota bacterium]